MTAFRPVRYDSDDDHWPAQEIQQLRDELETNEVYLDMEREINRANTAALKAMKKNIDTLADEQAQKVHKTIVEKAMIYLELISIYDSIVVSHSGNLLNPEMVLKITQLKTRGGLI